MTPGQQVDPNGPGDDHGRARSRGHLAGGMGRGDATARGADSFPGEPAAACQDASALAAAAEEGAEARATSSALDAALDAVHRYVDGGSDAGPYLEQIRAGEAHGHDPFRHARPVNRETERPDPDSAPD